MASSIWSPISGGITAPQGFLASGIRAGLKSSANPDLALLLAPKGAVCAGTFTQSKIRASCIDLCIERLKLTNSKARAVLINSGHANACTGERGLRDSLLATEAVAKQLALKSDEVLISSTGVIGSPIPIDKLLDSVDSLVRNLSTQGSSAAAKAILTTDLVSKEVAFEACLGGRTVRLGGIAKGSGMIHPSMATMLAYLSCDAFLPEEIWEEMVKKCVDDSFNMISVDGDTSTNDCCLGFSFGDPLATDYWNQLEIGISLVLQELAKAIVRDGEGSNFLIEVQVEGTETIREAKKIARTISSSSLVKTAIHGLDPNWGRILAAAGRAGVDFLTKDVSLWIGPFQLMELGKPKVFNKSKVSHYIKQTKLNKYMNNQSTLIRLKVGKGSGFALAWGCDLSAEYIHINADYTT